jgi:hypothetical protein
MHNNNDCELVECVDCFEFRYVFFLKYIEREKNLILDEYKTNETLLKDCSVDDDIEMLQFRFNHSKKKLFRYSDNLYLYSKSDPDCRFPAFHNGFFETDTPEEYCHGLVAVVRGVKFACGDYVKLTNKNDPDLPYIARIMKIKSGGMVDVRWMYRKDDFYDTSNIKENDLVASPFQDENSVEAIICGVLINFIFSGQYTVNKLYTPLHSSVTPEFVCSLIIVDKNLNVKEIEPSFL